MIVEVQDAKPVATLLKASGDPTEEEDASEPLAPGQRLRAAREAAGLAQEDIASELRLDLKMIRALEEGDVERLPEPVFTAGYLRSYARLLGLPPDELVAQYVDSETRDLPRMDANPRELPERYRKVAAALPSSFSLSTAQRRQSSRTRQQAVVGAGLAAVVIAIGWAVSYLWNHSNTPQLAQQSGSAQMVERQDGSASPQPAASGTADMAASAVVAEAGAGKTNRGRTPAGGTTAATGSGSPPKAAAPAGSMVEKDLPLKPLAGDSGAPATATAETAAPPVSADLTQLSLRFSDTSWVEIRDATGKRLIRELGLKGASKQIQGVAPFKVLLGYGPGVEIAYNGEPFDFSEYQGKRIARFTLHITDEQLRVKPDPGAALMPEDKAPLPEPEDD